MGVSLDIRRRRADEVYSANYQSARAAVFKSVRNLLRAHQAPYVADDELEDCYAQAWHALHSELLAGKRIEKLRSWLITTTFRRAIDEVRLARRRWTLPLAEADGVHVESDVAARMDDAARLRNLWEGMRLHLTKTERQAVALSVLHGMKRGEIAEHLGLPAKAVGKMMYGDERGPGVNARVAEVVGEIQSDFCSSVRWRSLMRAYARGLLDVDGERYQLAFEHYHSCPRCRAAVKTWRGVAAALPPVALPVSLAGSEQSAAMIEQLNGILHGTRGTLEEFLASPAGDSALGAAGAGAGAGAAGSGALAGVGGGGGGAGVAGAAGAGAANTTAAAGVAGAAAASVGAAAGGGALAGLAPVAKIVLACLAIGGGAAGCVAVVRELASPPAAKRPADHRTHRPAKASSAPGVESHPQVVANPRPRSARRSERAPAPRRANPSSPTDTTSENELGHEQASPAPLPSGGSGGEELGLE